MKNVWVALLITTGAVACADNHPAQNPTTTTAAASTTTVATAPHDTTSAGATTSRTGATADQTPTAVNGETGTSSVTTAGSTSSMATSDPTATSATSSSKLTPMDQGGSKGDRDITAAIRRDVVGDKSLSFSAKNVKIITKDGHVALRGQVKTDAEKATIDGKARNSAGVLDVDNQLEVKK